MDQIMAIAGGTWRRVLRMRVVYFLILCVWVLIASALNYDVLSLQHHEQFMIDISLLLNTVAAILVAISLTFEIPRELREGVASTLLAKPLGRTSYLIGKLLGTIVIGMVITALIGLGFFVIFKLGVDKPLVNSMILSHLFVMASVVPMCGIALFFSVIMPELLAPIATFVVIWLASSYSYALNGATGLYGGIVPDLDLYNLRAAAIYSTSIAWEHFLLVFLWGVVFCCFTTSFSSLIFGTRDLK